MTTFEFSVGGDVNSWSEGEPYSVVVDDRVVGTFVASPGLVALFDDGLSLVLSPATVSTSNARSVCVYLEAMPVAAQERESEP